MLLNLYSNFLNLIYKQNCVICGCAKTDEILCKSCLKNVQFLSSFAHRIYEQIPIYSMSNYENVIKKLIHFLKFKHKKKVAKVLAQLLFAYFQKLNLKENYIIVYPESYFIKNLSKGYNHSFLIAKEFSNLTGFELKRNLIQKVKPTKPQYKAKDRHKNIKNSFRINSKLVNEIKDKNILIIDDIITSGATLEEIINCFLKEDIKNLTCLTIAKSIK